MVANGKITRCFDSNFIKPKAQIPAGSDASAWRPRNASSMGSFCLFELYPATWEQITSYLKTRPAVYKKAVVIARVDSMYKWEQFFVYMSAIHYSLQKC